MKLLHARWRIQKARLFAITGLLVVLCTNSTVFAAGAISQSFTTTDDAVSGSVMDVDTSSKNVADLATSDHAEQLLGVVANQALVQLGDSGSKRVQVVTNGLTGVLVSDINGTIKTGDKITSSPIEGVGMKATSATTVVGIAQDDLSNVTTSDRSITDKLGKSQTVHIGTIPLLVNVTYYASNQDKLSPLIPSFLQSLSYSIVGHNVAALRIVIGSLALIMGFITIAIMLYSAVRSGIIAIGRNPLAQKALRKGLLEVVVTALGILVLTVMLVYVVLAT